MAKDVSSHHHRMPRTYMKPWCFLSDSIWTYDKATGISERRNIYKICWESYYYSIRAGSIYTNDDALNKTYGLLSAHRIEFDGTVLSTPKDLNDHFLDFDKWDIFYPNGKRANKRDRNIIEQRLLSSSVNTIEERWSSRFENDWALFSDTIFQNLGSVLRKGRTVLTDYEAKNLMKYFVMFEWRGMIGNEMVNDVLQYSGTILKCSDVEIPRKERTYPNGRYEADEIKHAFLLKVFGEFLSDDGAMYEVYKLYCEKLSFVFLISDNENFVTSDNLCFTFINREGYKELVFIARPNFAISLAKKDPSEPHAYKIHTLRTEDVVYFNKIISKMAI